MCLGKTMLVARIATQHAKPNGQFIIRSGDIDELIKKEKISSLPGIGYNIFAKLRKYTFTFRSRIIFFADKINSLVNLIKSAVFYSAFGEMNLCEDLQKIPIDRLRNLLGEKIGTQVNSGNKRLVYNYFTVILISNAFLFSQKVI